MRIGTYNLKFLFDAGTRLHSGKECTFTADFVDQRFAFFAEQFDQLDADILFLQELGDESALKKILGQTKTSYSYFIASPDNYGVGNAVIYKQNLQCVCSSITTNTSLPVFNNTDEDSIGPRLWSRRDYVKLETVYEGQPLTAFGVHIKSRFLMYEAGSSFPTNPETLTQVDAADAIIRSELFRLSQAKKLRESLDETFSHNQYSRVIALGDFNAIKSSEVLRIIYGNIKNRDDVLAPVFSSENVDHILVSKSLEGHITKKEIFEDSVVSDSPDSVGSDHAPLLIEISPS